MAPDPSPSEVHPWLKTLPLAPEYHPTLAEFQDPIAYILKIEKEASQFGICKIVPPVPPAAKKIAVANLNRSFAARSPGKSPTFTTRHQQVGFCPRKPRPMQKPVWQSGEEYTLQQFEAKAKQFDKAQLKRTSKKHLSPLETETLFWRACADKPFTVEYANDIPGSGFAPLSVTGKSWREEEPGNVGESAWNMRGVSRAKGSLLRFMKEDIAGVTSPMVYVAMLFSWFAWHVEDHDLHSMNYLHLGAGKTWYGVPRDAGLAFEDVVRMHGYCGEVNPLVTFAILGEKTTVMSPEVLISAGIPCCRLVQNAGEFVVTFPGAYHSGFSHGFNCAEAANIATPEWLKIAKAAAIRRASTNYPPMVSHFQLLYALALSLCSRVPISISNEPRSSRLKHKMKGEGEAMVKSMFVENVIQNNDLLGILLDKGSRCVVLPHNASSSPLFSGPVTNSKMTAKPRLSLGLSSHEEAVEASEVSFSDDRMLERKGGIKHFSGFCSRRASSVSVSEEKKPNSVKYCRFGSANICSTSAVDNAEGENDGKLHGDGLLDRGLLSCVMCGILSFACVAVIQPREATARYLMSADCSFLKDQILNAGEITNSCIVSKRKEQNTQLVTASEQTESEVQDIMDDNLVDCDIQSVRAINQNVELVSDTASQKDVTALDLLASAYGYSSDSEEETFCEKSVCNEDLRQFLSAWHPKQQLHVAISSENPCSRKASSNGTDRGVYSQREALGMSRNSAKLVSVSAANNQLSTLIDAAANLHALTGFGTKESCRWKAEFSAGAQSGFPEMFISHDVGDKNMGISSSLTRSRGVTHFNGGDFEVLDSSCGSTEKVSMSRSDAKLSDIVSGSEDKTIPLDSCCDKVPPTRNDVTMLQHNLFDTSTKNLSLSVMQTSDRDSSRMHIFCLEHALEIEKQLHLIGGVDIMLLCHPEYPKIEAEAQTLANDLGINHLWKDIPYKEANKEDQQKIRSALEDEEAIPMNSDWAVKLGINLYYSASLSKTSIYSKQLPYNAVIYKAFVHNSAAISPVKPKGRGKRSGRKKKLVVSGRWCGKVWMSNQVHPYLAHRDDQDREHVDTQDEQGNGQQSLVQSDTEHDDFIDSPKRPETNTAAARKSGKRRKKPLQKLSSKKPRRTEIGNSDSIQDEAENSSAQGGRILRSSNSKNAATPSRNKITTQHNQNSRDEAEGTSCLRLKKQKSTYKDVKVKSAPRKQIVNKNTKKTQADYEAEDDDTEYPCNLEGCTMSFGTKQDLVLHKRNICPVKGCGKKFFSHKYLVQHRKVHVDDRPLKCPWKGCKMTFKWPWARTEHIRVHTGDRPYICGEAGCGQTFRFVSDFSRHKRKTGHSVKKNRR